MKKIMRLAVKTMMAVVVLWSIKLAVVDMWDCYLAVDMFESAKTVWAMI